MHCLICITTFPVSIDTRCFGVTFLFDMLLVHRLGGYRSETSADLNAVLESNQGTYCDGAGAEVHTHGAFEGLVKDGLFGILGFRLS